MSKYLSYGGFKWVDSSLRGLDDLDDMAPVRRLYEVGISYPANLHKEHNNLPFIPDNSISVGSKILKLMAPHLKRKTNM